MRDLTADERAIVAGGYWSDYEDDSWYSQRFALRDYYFGGGPRYYVDANGLETVVVNAPRDEPSPYGMQFFWSPSGAGYGNGGGGGETDKTPDVRDVTCIELKPKVADLKAMHQLAVDAAKSAPLTSKETPWGTVSQRAVEHGVLMYTLPGDPTVYPSERAIGTSTSIPNQEWYRVLNNMPAGAVIVGVWHSHPDALALPSGYVDYPAHGGDWQFMKNLWASRIGDSLFTWRVDPNAMLYITGADGKTYVYDKSDYNAQGGMASGSKSCPVNRNG